MKLILKRKLKDYEAWKKVVMENDGLRQQYGSHGGTAYRSASNPDEVYLVFDWDDAKPYTDYMNRPDVKQAFDATGTLEIVEVSEFFQID